MAVDRRTFRLVLAVLVLTVAFIALVVLVTVWSGTTYYTNAVVNSTLHPAPSPVVLSSVSTLAFVLTLVLLVALFILGIFTIYNLLRWVAEKLGKPQFY